MWTVLRIKDLLWADMVFIGGMAVQRESAKQIIACCKALNLKVVAGGPLFTSEPDEFKEVDHLVLDETELTFPAFLSDLQNGQPKHFQYMGIITVKYASYIFFKSTCIAFKYKEN
uniref:B12-binding domain-containing protein n=2 Tax=Desulfobacterium TaxID=2295 RepID=E1YH41_9BACT|nr:hypothetical protein N47_F15800 [uncultured Desulfobacterium sp.]